MKSPSRSPSPSSPGSKSKTGRAVDVELPGGLDERAQAQMVSELCSWFAEQRRDLPWRRNRDPYSIWISEAMLQQTRVETVLDYHRRFLERLPSIQHLAEAPEEEVLALWSGLGYYRRARSLHAAAKLLVERHAGEIPPERSAFLELPGVGPYTAGAVLSIAFQASEALVDGNVGRVFSRLFGLRGEISAGPTQRQLWSLARALVPASVSLAEGQTAPRICPGNWNQALMELGALVCKPQAPDCEACPLQERCVAKRDGLTEVLPEKRKQPASLEVSIEVLWLEVRGRCLLRQRPAGGRMAGLWELPTRELPTRELGAAGPESHGLWPLEWELGALGEHLELQGALHKLSHAITKHRIRGQLLAGACKGAARLPEKSGLRWANAEQCAALGLTGLTRKCLARMDF